MVYVSFPISRPYFRGWSWNYSTLLHHCSIIFAHSMLVPWHQLSLHVQCRKRAESWVGGAGERVYTCVVSCKILRPVHEFKAVSHVCGGKILVATIRPGKLDLLFCISHLLDLHVGGQSLFIIPSLAKLMLCTLSTALQPKLGVYDCLEGDNDSWGSRSQRKRALNKSSLPGLTVFVNWLSASIAVNAQSILLHAGNKCYEAKIEESEKAGSCWELNPGHLWLEPPVLCHWANVGNYPLTV